MFASVRAAFNIPRDANLKLRDFPTLAHVIQFARDRHAASEAEPVAAADRGPGSARAADSARASKPRTVFRAACRPRVCARRSIYASRPA